MKRVFISVVMFALLALGGLAQAVKIETVFVGDKGNAADTTGYGSVAYNYNIGKYEVTAGQYAEFLNAKAKSDPYWLYKDEMQSFAIGCHIIRNGISGNYSYSVASGYENRPVNYVSYWSAARFTNWLQNGQGNGDTETGAYTLNGYKGWEGGNIVRNAGWEWAITSEDEWYKAAYYDPNMTGGTKYWLYPTSSNTAPGRDLTDVTGNNANSEGGLGPPYYTTIVGEFQNSASTYGTFDQGGNVWEWTESIYTRSNRLLRGGGLAAGTYALAASHREYNYQPSSANGYWGFRVVQAYVPQAVPEPATLLGFGIPMLMIGLGKLRGLRK